MLIRISAILKHQAVARWLVFNFPRSYFLWKVTTGNETGTESRFVYSFRRFKALQVFLPVGISDLLRVLVQYLSIQVWIEFEKQQVCGSLVSQVLDLALHQSKPTVVKDAGQPLGALVKGTMSPKLFSTTDLTTCVKVLPLIFCNYSETQAIYQIWFL